MGSCYEKNHKERALKASYLPAELVAKLRDSSLNISLLYKATMCHFVPFWVVDIPQDLFIVKNELWL